MLILQFLTFAALVIPSWQQGSQMGPVGRLDVKKIEECPNAKSAVKLQLVQDYKKRKAVDAQVNFGFDYNEKVTFKLLVDKWTGSEWKKKVMSYDGGLCEFVNKNAPDIRKRIYSAAKIAGNCAIKKGNYKFNKCYATEKDLKITAIPYGTFRMELQLLDANKKSLVCYIIDMDSFPPK